MKASKQLIPMLILTSILALGCGKEAVSTNAQALFKRGKAAYVKRELAPARSFFAAAVKEAPAFANGWVMLGKSCFFLKDQKSARQALKKAVSLAPTHIEAHYYLARLQLLKKDTASAINTLNAILLVDPNNSRANYSLGSLYAEKNNLKQAFHHFSMALREEGMMARIRYTWAATLLRTGLKKRAKEILAPALQFQAHDGLKKQIQTLWDKLK